MHSLSRRTAAVRGDHNAVFIFIEHYAQRIEPTDRLGGFRHQFFEQFFLVLEMPAAESVEIVNRRRIVFFIRRLNTAFRHRRVRVADTQFRHHQNVCTRVFRFDRRRSARAAAADDQHVYVVSDLV